VAGVPRKRSRCSPGVPLFSPTPRKWRGAVVAATQRFVSPSGISGPRVPHRSVLTRVGRMWNIANGMMQTRDRGRACNALTRTRARRARASARTHSPRVDALRQACKRIIVGNKTPRITAALSSFTEMLAIPPGARQTPAPFEGGWTGEHSRFREQLHLGIERIAQAQ